MTMEGEPMANDASARALAESMGFVYWPGGDAPPADWDGGPYLCRDGKTYWLCGYDWGHGTHCWNPTASWDRIGYKRKAAEDDPRMTQTPARQSAALGNEGDDA